jgi:ankyrin repeat protein
MASTLPDNPSVNHLREQARSLQRRVSSGDPRGVELVRRHHPKPDIALAHAPDGFALHDAQVTVARGYGFSGWPALVHYLDIAADLGVDPSRIDEDTLSEADRFCALAVLRYTDTDAPPRRAAAAAMIAAEPALADRHVWAAAAAADPLALSSLLSERRDLSMTAGGPFGWVPLMYLCYSRVDIGRTQSQVVTAATILLQAGADPNAGYLWRGMSTPFTVLTGVFGEGEQGPRRQPRHPFAPDLATLLLEWGAHPVDQQTLYNRMFRPDDSHLELLFDYGLGDAGPSPWEHRLGEAIPTREQMWHSQIAWAAEHGFAQRLDLLARHGVDVSGADLVMPAIPDEPNVRDEHGATALHHAAWDGDLRLIERLLDAGADPAVTDSRFGSTPQGWAEHAYQTEAAEVLRAATAGHSQT